MEKRRDKRKLFIKLLTYEVVAAQPNILLFYLKQNLQNKRTLNSGLTYSYGKPPVGQLVGFPVVIFKRLTSG